MPSFDTVAQQQKLKARNSPYWRKLATGQHVGVRKTSAGLHWHARGYDPATGKQPRQALGAFDHMPAHARFDAACAAAREWFQHLGQGGSAEAVTVRLACERYVQNLRDAGRKASATDAAGRFERFVFADPLALVVLAKLSRDQVKQWRVRMAAALKREQNPEAERTAKRSASAINRDLVPLRAALNLAKDAGSVSTDAAWSVELRPIKGAGRRRELYLTQDQRRALLAALTADVRPFVHALCLLPMRPGAVAALTVDQYNARAGTLLVDKDKTHGRRSLLLPEAVGALFTAAAGQRSGQVPIFARADDTPWNKDAWKYPIKDAAAAAELPAGTTAYTLRHSTITDLVTDGLDLFTVAKLAGTSVAMIEKHYGHLQQKRAQAALAKLVL